MGDGRVGPVGCAVAEGGGQALVDDQGHRGPRSQCDGQRRGVAAAAGQRVQRCPAHCQPVVEGHAGALQSLLGQVDPQQPGVLLGGDLKRRAGPCGVLPCPGLVRLPGVERAAHRFHHLGGQVAGGRAQDEVLGKIADLHELPPGWRVSARVPAAESGGTPGGGFSSCMRSCRSGARRPGAGRARGRRRRAGRWRRGAAPASSRRRRRRRRSGPGCRTRYGWRPARRG